MPRRAPASAYTSGDGWELQKSEIREIFAHAGVVLLLHGVHPAVGFRQQLLRVGAVVGVVSFAHADRQLLVGRHFAPDFHGDYLDAAHHLLFGLRH